MTTYILLVLGVALNVAAQVALKLAGLGLAPIGADGVVQTFTYSTILAHPLRVLSNPWFLAGLVLYAVSVLNWLVVLRRLEISVAYPLTSIGYIMTMVLGVLLFREQISIPRMIGVLVIIIGVILVTRPVSSLHG